MDIIGFDVGRRPGKSYAAAIAAVAGTMRLSGVVVYPSRANRRGNRPSDVERRLRHERKRESEECRCARRLSWDASDFNIDFKPRCSCCGKLGKHYMVGSLSEPGFFICEPSEGRLR